MYSNTVTGNSPKGSVALLSSNGRLQLRFSYGGKRHYVSTGLADTATNRQLAQTRASEIEKDILEERFDETLEKYKPKSALSTITPVTPIGKPKPKLDQLWEKYSEYKKPQVSPSTYAKDFTKQKNHISKLPSKSLDDAEVIKDYLVTNLTTNAAKRVLTQLKACCEWALAEKIISHHPFGSMKIDAPLKASEDADIKPFSKKERDLIIQTFSNNRYYSHYTNFVRFLFWTGCRPSEAIALQWHHIENGVIKFRQSVVISENGLVLKEGLKTQQKRDFPITAEVQIILDDAKAETASSEGFIFTSPQGKFIDQHNFATRAWKSILEECKILYRKAYQTRHTFITQCVEADINSTAIGRWTGTSSKMIDNHYGATNFTNLRPPSLI